MGKSSRSELEPSSFAIKRSIKRKIKAVSLLDSFNDERVNSFDDYFLKRAMKILISAVKISLLIERCILISKCSILSCTLILYIILKCILKVLKI